MSSRTCLVSGCPNVLYHTNKTGYCNAHRRQAPDRRHAARLRALADARASGSIRLIIMAEADIARAARHTRPKDLSVLKTIR